MILDCVKLGPGQGLECFVAIVIHVDFLLDSAEPEMVSNDKGVHTVVLGQFWIGFLKLPDLFGIEDMEFLSELTQLVISRSA